MRKATVRSLHEIGHVDAIQSCFAGRSCGLHDPRALIVPVLVTAGGMGDADDSVIAHRLSGDPVFERRWSMGYDIGWLL